MGVADGGLNKGHSLPHLPSGEAGSLGTLLGMRAWLHPVLRAHTNPDARVENQRGRLP